MLMADGSEIKGMVYVMCEGYKEGSPAKSYYDAIRGAYEKLGLGSQIETILEPALARCLSRC